MLEFFLGSPSTVNQSNRNWRLAFAAIFYSRVLRSQIPERIAIPRANSFHTIDILPENRPFETTQSALTELVEKRDPTRLHDLGGVAAVASSIQTDLLLGISGGHEDIARRRQVFGSNTFLKPPAKGFFRFVVEASLDLTNVIIFGCAALSLVFGILHRGLEYGLYDAAVSASAAVFRIIAIAAVRNYLQNSQFDKLWEVSIKTRVDVVRSGHPRQVSISEAVVGDVVCLKTGDQVPADGLFIDGHSLQIDKSSMTEESNLVEINLGQNPFLFSGAKVAGGYGTMVVTSVGMNTNWGQTMSRVSRDCSERTPLQERLDKLTSAIGRFGVAFALLVLLVLLIRYFTGKTKDGRGVSEFNGGNTKAALIVIAVAGMVLAANSTVSDVILEGLPLAITLTLAYSMKRMMDDQAVVKKLSACEAIGSATTICTDKTGILTMNQMKVTKVWLGQRWVQGSEISGVSHRVVELVGDGAALNTKGTAYRAAPEGEFEFSGSPTEKAILSWVNSGLVEDVESRKESFEILNLETFSSENKRSGVLIRKKADKTVHSHWKGAAEMILGMCSSFYEATGLVKEIDDYHRKDFNKIIESMAADSLRCIALAHSEVSEPVEENQIEAKQLTLLGFIGIEDQCHPGVKKAIEDCQKAGVDVKMITGDNVHTAKAIAIECGILGQGMPFLMEEAVVEGEEFRGYTPEEQMEKSETIRVLARALPSDKLRLVQCLKQKGQLVAVTGSRTKDSPALKEAGVGLCMGIQGAMAAKESADIILLDSSFASVATVLKWGGCVYKNFQKLIEFQLTVNITALIVNVVAAVSTGGVPLSSDQLFWVNLITDTRSALALATEQPAIELMDKKLADPTEPLITNIMWRNLLSQAFYQITVLLTLQFRGESMLGVGKEVNGALILNTFVLCQVFKGFNARKPEKKNVMKGILRNRLFIGIVGVMTLLQVLMGEFLYKFAGTARLNGGQWGICIGFAALTWPISWAAKFIPVPEKPIFSYLKWKK